MFVCMLCGGVSVCVCVVVLWRRCPSDTCGCRYHELLAEASSPDCPGGAAIHGFQHIGDAYPDCTILSLPYFDGDNWPGIIETLISEDDKVRREAQRRLMEKREVELRCAEVEREARSAAVGVNPQFRKPGTTSTPTVGGHYVGHSPPMRRPQPRRPVVRRRSDSGNGSLSLDDRLNKAIHHNKRDFLVIKLRTEGDDFMPDPDAHVSHVSVGTKYSLSGCVWPAFGGVLWP